MNNENMFDNMGEMLGVDRKDTAVDVVFAIDVTKSTEKFLEQMKELTIGFRPGLEEKLKAHHRDISELRTRLIAFRDVYVDGDKAFETTDFMDMPEDEEAFTKAVEALESKGGGDVPENALEALSLAMQSDFNQGGTTRRHIIVLFSDAPAHPLEDREALTQKAKELGCENIQYPKDMPKSLEELCNIWQGNDEFQNHLDHDGVSGSLDPDGRRLVLFTPNVYPWDELELELKNTLRQEITLGNGGEDICMDDVFNMIACSIRN